MNTYKEAIKLANSQLFELTEHGDNSFILEGKYFTLDFRPMHEDIQLNVHEKNDVIVECMMEELAEMTVISEQLRPFMNKLVESSNKEQ
jgi:hypothetical protein